MEVIGVVAGVALAGVVGYVLYKRVYGRAVVDLKDKAKEVKEAVAVVKGRIGS